MTVGDRIKRKREELGISQIELAKSFNASKQTLYKYENNIVTNIPLNNIEMIAKKLRVSPGYLMGWEDELVQIDTDAVVDIMSNQRIMEYAKRLMMLSESSQQTICDNIDFLLKKEGRD